MSSGLPVILIEVVLVFGGTLAFGWWQLRSVKRDSEAARRETEAVRAREAADAVAPPPPAAPPPSG